MGGERLEVKWDRENLDNIGCSWIIQIDDPQKLFNMIRAGAEKILPVQVTLKNKRKATYSINRAWSSEEYLPIGIKIEGDRYPFPEHCLSFLVRERALVLCCAEPERDLWVLKRLLSEAAPDITWSWEPLPTPEELEKLREEERERERKRREERRRLEEEIRRKQEAELERRRREEELEQLWSRVSERDLEVLELRKKGVSLWGICRELNLTMNSVYHSLRKLYILGHSGLPELLEDWPPELQPKTREERYKPKG